MSNDHHIKQWADIRTTSVEIARAIFELANNDEELAQKIWEEGSDQALAMAFAKTDKDELFWGTEAMNRADL